MPNPPRVAIIILNWNGEADSQECLSSLGKLQYDNYHIIVVDNGSNDGSGDRLKEKFPEIKLIKNHENIGFAAGNNVGIEAALNDGVEMILLLNNDTVVASDFLANLVDTLKDDDQIGVVSPKILSYQDKAKIWFGGGAFLPVIRKPFHQYYQEDDVGQINKIAETEWVSGCCMLVGFKVFKKIGLLDPDYFNNYEDVDFCLRATKAGYKIAVVPQAKIYHKFAASMGGKFSPFYTYFRTRNNLLFFKKTHQGLALILNFMIFPIYSIIGSLAAGNLASIKATYFALFDFLRGKYGMGSAGKFEK
ncbi:MAG: glycosyltransferase family 2 protein [Candidatus Saganbacteria bacterium]|nr:glycosyltransferase family 2 protein [Candidatus Saganbacteria bacterium]